MFWSLWTALNSNRWNFIARYNKKIAINFKNDENDRKTKNIEFTSCVTQFITRNGKSLLSIRERMSQIRFDKQSFFLSPFSVVINDVFVWIEKIIKTKTLQWHCDHIVKKKHFVLSFLLFYVLWFHFSLFLDGLWHSIYGAIVFVRDWNKCYTVKMLIDSVDFPLSRCGKNNQCNRKIRVFPSLGQSANFRMMQKIVMLTIRLFFCVDVKCNSESWKEISHFGDPLNSVDSKKCTPLWKSFDQQFLLINFDGILFFSFLINWTWRSVQVFSIAQHDSILFVARLLTFNLLPHFYSFFVCSVSIHSFAVIVFIVEQFYTSIIHFTNATDKETKSQYLLLIDSSSNHLIRRISLYSCLCKFGYSMGVKWFCTFKYVLLSAERQKKRTHTQNEWEIK